MAGKFELNKDDTYGHAVLDWKKPSHGNIHTIYIIQNRTIVFRNIYACTYVHETTIDDGNNKHEHCKRVK